MRSADLQRVLHGALATNSWLARVDPGLGQGCPFCAMSETVRQVNAITVSVGMSVCEVAGGVYCWDVYNGAQVFEEGKGQMCVVEFSVCSCGVGFLANKEEQSQRWRDNRPFIII